MMNADKYLELYQDHLRVNGPDATECELARLLEENPDGEGHVDCIRALHESINREVAAIAEAAKWKGLHCLETLDNRIFRLALEY